MSEQEPNGDGTAPQHLAILTDPPHETQTRLAESVRRLTEAVVTTTADPATLDEIADRIDELTPPLNEHRREGSYRLGVNVREEGIPYHYNPVIGPANPYAPPVELEIADGEVWARAQLCDVYEGPPGYVHGGILSLILDQTLGLANVVAGHPGMTVSLEVRYRRPTPLHVPLEIHSRFSHTEGRTIYSTGSIAVDGQTTVEATGVFRTITPDRSRQLFANRLDT
jgi:acyl-coenzyme A thioesterase PaaI-like protein